MEFFDKKEEVMDIVMTRRGRELYATGDFVPAYYAFCDDEIIYEAQTVTGSNQTLVPAATATFEGLSTMDDVNSLQLTLVDAFSNSVTFTYDTGKNETQSTRTLIGTALTATTAAKATESLHRAIRLAIENGDLKMTLGPAEYTNETIFTLGQQGNGGPGGTGGLTTITVPTHISAGSRPSGTNGVFARTASTFSGGTQLETQNRTAQRIKDVPRVKLQSGTQAAMGLKGHMTSSIFEPRFKVLGKSSNIDEEAPAWQVKVVNERGLMSGSVKFVPTEMSGALDPASGVPIFKDTKLCTDAQMLTKYNGETIPQISIYCDYDVQIVDVLKHLLSEQEVATYKKLVEAEKTNKNLESQVALSNFKNTIIGPHGGSLAMMLKKSSDDIVLDFTENNVDFTGNTLEVYEYQYNKVNDITGMRQLNFSDEHHGTDFVEYFFDVSTDKEAEIDLQIEFVDESLFEGLEEEDIVDCPPGQLPTATAAQIKPPLGTGEIPATPKPPTRQAPTKFTKPGFHGDSCVSDDNCFVGTKCKSGKCMQPPDDVAGLDKGLGKQCLKDADCTTGQKCIQYQHGIQNRKCGKK